MTKVQPEHLSVSEIAKMIALYEGMLQQKQEAAQAAEGPYRDAEDIMREAQENLKLCGGRWQEARLEVERTEATLQKLRHLHHATRGGLLFADQKGGTKRLRKLNWVEDAVEVLKGADRFLCTDELMALLGGKHAGAALPTSALKLGEERILAAAARPGNTTGPGRKKMLALWEGHVGLQAWMMPSGRPAPKYLVSEPQTINR